MKKYASLLLFLLTGCSSLQMTTSIPEEELKENQFNQYDSDSNIRFVVSNDQDKLHLKFKTSEQSSIMNILRGTTVYFDTHGKKKKKVYLEYPLAQEGNTMRPDQSQMQGQRTRPDQSQMQGERTRPDVGKALENLPMEAIFTNHDESELIQFSLIENDIKPSLRKSGDSEITYELIIPFHRLAEGGLASIENLSVGIVTETPEAQSQGGGGGMGGAGGGMSGGMGGRGGGMGGGMGGPGGGMGGGMGGQGGGPGGQGGGPGGSGQNSMSSAIDIWFQVDLNRK